MNKSNLESALSVIIPAYNEQKNIRETVLRINDTLNKHHILFEIIVVDDGSSDNTYTNIPAGSNITKTRHEQNLGYGAALKTGIRKAIHNNILIIDADGTYPIQSIPDLHTHIQDYDMVVGARIGQSVKIPLLRKPAKWVLTKLANYISGFAIPDLNSGLRIIKRSLIHEFWHLLPSGFSFTTTITLAAINNSYNIKFIPIDYFTRQGQSKIRAFTDTLNFLSLILHTILYFKPLKVFIPSGLLLFIVSIAKFIYDGVVFKFYISGSTIVLAMMALQVIVLGIVADLIVSYRRKD